jgi:Spy/CpxP family protein refolding chaperone
MRCAIALMILCVLAVNVRAQDNHALTEAQKTAIQAIEVGSATKAAPIAARLAGVVRQIYANRLADMPDEVLATSLGTEMRDLTWQLLSIKGESMWAAVGVLTPEQKQIIRAELAKRQQGTDLTDLMELITQTFKVQRK